MVLEPDVEHLFSINGVPCHFRRFTGSGHLNVETGIGEVKATAQDYIVTLASGRKFVLPGHVAVTMIETSPEFLALEAEAAAAAEGDNAELNEKEPVVNGAKGNAGAQSAIDEAEQIRLAQAAEKQRKLDEELKGLDGK